MRSATTPEFWTAYRRLPPAVRRRAREAYRQFSADRFHPGLRFKRVGRKRPVYSVRLNRDYRVLGLREADDILWFWIGPHHEYDRLLKQL